MNEIPEKSKELSQIDENNNNLNTDPNNNLYKNFLEKIKKSLVIANRLDYYPNSIPLGSFCFAVSFILHGFVECKVHKDEDYFLFLIILFFGGIGQLTAGIFEFIKSRTYPATLYITYGIYFLSFFLANKFKDNEEKKYFDVNAQKIYFGSWAFIGAPLIIYSIRINIFFLIQNIAVVAFFVIKSIGVAVDKKGIKEITPGILELVAGFSSLYICYGQILNEHLKTNIFPSIPLKQDNDIDDFNIKREE